MEEAPENSKKSSHSGIECSRLADEAKLSGNKT
jgi:hypothetical protein